MSALFLKILNMSVCASWIAAAVLVLRFCLKRAPKWANVLLWGFVAVRLLLPFSIESMLSLLPRTEVIRPAVTNVPVQTAAAPALLQARFRSGRSSRGSGWPEPPYCFCTARSAASASTAESARPSACGAIFISPSASTRRSCLGRSARKFICHTAWTAAAGMSSPTSRRICAGAIICGSRSAFCC